MRVAITGASGFTGSALAASLRMDGHDVIAVGRGSSADVRWDPGSGQLDAHALAGLDAVVNVAGANVGERWTAERKRAIRESRVLGTQLLSRNLAALDPGERPRVFVCASAMGYYGSRGDAWLDETSPPGSDFLAGVARDWEAAADAAREAHLRVVHLRSGLVLSPRGGALAKMLPAFRLGAGARLGSGAQWMSWIALSDLVRAYRFVIDEPSFAGPANAVAPTPVTNAEFTATLARVLRRPAVASVPAFALRALFGEMGVATLLASQRVRPARLEAAGFTFAHGELESALRFEMVA